MNLYINAVTSKKSVIFFSEERMEHMETWTEVGTESIALFTAFEAGMKALALAPEDIEHVVVVSGPGAFTGLRIILTFVNTLAFLFPHIHVHPVTAGQLCAVLQPSPLYIFSPYPSDVFVFEANGDLRTRLSSQEWEEAQEQYPEYAGIWPQDAALFAKGLRIEEERNSTISDLQKLCAYPVQKGYIEPLYAKQPNISQAKKL